MGVLGVFSHLIFLFLVIGKSSSVYCPYYCRCSMTYGARHVKCIDQNLVSVDLEVPRSVSWLQLSHNLIFELKDYVFQELGLERIIDLNLDHNQIQHIGINAFSGMMSLRNVDLGYNHLNKISKYTFENNKRLYSLNFEGNPLHYLPRHQSFLISDSLQILVLSNCRLIYLEDVSFSEIPLLRKLDLSNNAIVRISPVVLASLTNINVINITNTAISNRCNEESNNLQNWSKNGSKMLIGYSCNKEPKPKMFEKLIVKEESKEEKFIEFEEFSNEPCNCDINEPKLLEKNAHNKNQKEKNKFFWIMLIVFCIGFCVGATIATLVVILYRYCRKICRTNRITNDFNRSEIFGMINHGETPPPSYSDICY